MSYESKKGVNANVNSNKDLNFKMNQVTYQDLIIFKEELLKDLRNYKNKISTNINNQFDKYNRLLEKSNQNLNYYEKDKSSFMTKIDFTEEKEKLFFELTNKNNDLKNQVMTNQVHISSCRKDIDNSCFKYDQIISDNLLVPGLIGKSCKYQNLKEYILFNKEEINNALTCNKQVTIDINLLKKKFDTINGQVNTKLKSLEYRITNFITSKFNEVGQKFDVLYDELNKRMNTLNHDVKSNVEERNNELARLKNFVFEENSKAVDDVKNIKEEINTEFKKIKITSKDIKKNIVCLTNLLMGKNFNQNKQSVMSNFNNMMLELFQEFNLAPKTNQRLTLQTNVFPNPNSDIIRRKSTIAPNATSFIKKYIEGKITVDEAKFSHENKSFKRKKSLQLKDTMKSNFISESAKNFGELNSIFLDKKNRLSISVRKEDIKRNGNIDLSNNFFSPQVKKTFYKRNTTTFINTPKSFKKSEIIQEEDSNKYLSSQSSNEEITNKEDKRKISSDFNTSKNDENKEKEKLNNITEIKEKDKLNNITEIKEKDKLNNIKEIKDKDKLNNIKEIKEKEKNIIKRNIFDKEKISELNTNTNDEKIIEFNENSSSHKKINNKEEIPQRNTNNITTKTSFTNNISSDSSNSPKQKISINIQPKQNDFNIVNNYFYFHKKTNKNVQNSEKEENKIDEKNDRMVNSNNHFNKKRLFNGLMPETTANFNIEEKQNTKKIKRPSSINKNIFPENILQQSNEKFSVLNKINLTNSISIKTNSDLKNIKESINKIDKTDNNILYSYNNSKKSLKEGPKLALNIINNGKKRKDSPIVIKSREIKSSNRNINVLNINKDIAHSSKNSNSNNSTKTKFFQYKDLELKNQKNQKINNKEKSEVDNDEENKNFSSFQKEKNRANSNHKNNDLKLQSAKKQEKRKLKLNKTNIVKDDKEIYLTKDILTSTRYIKDEDIIDKPLLFDMNVFKVEKNKGNLENRVNELEYFLKKKLDELVKEIKIFIPIHFNSHIRNYTVDKNK